MPPCCADELADRLAQLAVTVVTQPSLWTRFGAQYLRESAPDDRRLLWRHASLLARGVQVAVSSDAPYGDPDPWHTIWSATRRELADGTVGGPDEASVSRGRAGILSRRSGRAGRSVAHSCGLAPWPTWYCSRTRCRSRCSWPRSRVQATSVRRSSLAGWSGPTRTGRLGSHDAASTGNHTSLVRGIRATSSTTASTTAAMNSRSIARTEPIGGRSAQMTPAPLGRRRPSFVQH